MMYTQFLCTALLLSNSFFTLQGMARTITWSEANKEKLNSELFEPSLYYEDEFLKHDRPSCGFSHANPIRNVEGPRSTSTLSEDQDIEASTNVKVGVKVDVIAKTVTRYMPTPSYITDDYESPGAYWDRIERQDREKLNIRQLKTNENPHEAPNMHYMSAESGEAYMVFGSIAGVSAFAPILAPFTVGGALGYIVYKIIQDNSKKKATKKALKEAEKKALEEKNKNNSGGDPKKPDDKENEEKAATIVAVAKKLEEEAKKGLNKNQKKELDKQNRNPSKNEPIGNKGAYEDAGYHHPNSKGVKSPAPKNGQKALNNSVKIKDESNRRVGVSDGEIVILDETSPGKYHGHVRSWNDVSSNQKIKNALIDSGLVDSKGRIK